MSSKIKIKIGQIEVEYEGNEDYLINELPNLLAKVTEIYSSVDIETNLKDQNDSPVSVSQNSLIKATTGTIAAKLKCKSGKDLIIAACAHLAFAKGKETFERANILEEMKKASSYYKNTYSANLTKYLTQLVRNGKLIERSKNHFALEANTRSELENAIKQ